MLPAVAEPVWPPRIGEIRKQRLNADERMHLRKSLSPSLEAPSLGLHELKRKVAKAQGEANK
jgi:hypothetical protein